MMVKNKHHILKLVASAFIITLCSCGKGESEDPIIDSEEQEKVVTYNVEGVWEQDNYFISFNNDGFYCAYLGNYFIDSGTWKYSSDSQTITCNNTYFNRTTIYNISPFTTDKKLVLSVEYNSYVGNSMNNFKNYKGSYTLSKTNKNPTPKDHKMVGKSFTITNSSLGDVTRYCNTYNSGLKKAAKAPASKHPLNTFYVFVDDKYYEQCFSSESFGSIGGWNHDFGDISAYKLSFTNGKVSGWDIINLKE